MEPEGVAAYLDALLPHALVTTPNLREAAILGGTSVEVLETVAARVAVAERIRATGARYVVVKGGHLSDSADDVVAGPDGTTVLAGTRVATGNDHGTGCSLSAAIAALLAQGLRRCPTPSRKPRPSWPVRWPAAAAWHLGAGHGPLDHFGWSGPP